MAQAISACLSQWSMSYRWMSSNPPIVVIGELKLTFNLELILQAVDRAGAADEVWLAARFSALGKGRESDARYRNLCRRLGFGMLAVTGTGDVEVIVKPATAAPPRNPKKRSRLVSEHQRRKGDPAMGGSTRAPIMTAYRQQALACASALQAGPRRVKDLRVDIPDAGKILLHNVYGWFARVEELDGCMSQGATPDEAVAGVRDAMVAWISVELEDGNAIPGPRSEPRSSGRFLVRTPRGRKATPLAYELLGMPVPESVIFDLPEQRRFFE